MSSNVTLDKDDLASILSRINSLVKRQENEVDTTDSDESDDDIPVLTEIYIGVDAEAMMRSSDDNLGVDESMDIDKFVDIDELNTIDKPDGLGESDLGLSNTGEWEGSGIDQLPPLSQELVERFLSEMQPLILKAVKLAVLEESVKAEQVLTQKLEQEILLLLRNRLITHMA